METNIGSINNTPESRKAERDEIERQTQEFLKSGGYIENPDVKTDSEIIESISFKHRSRTISHKNKEEKRKDWGRGFKL